jgi:hypothetical protein
MILDRVREEFVVPSRVALGYEQNAFRVSSERHYNGSVRYSTVQYSTVDILSGSFSLPSFLPIVFGSIFSKQSWLGLALH